MFFGSVVNKDDKATILSGDAIVSKIAGVADILFFTDVYGVALESGEVVSEFAMSDIDDVIERAIKENVEDATGGMIGKLDKLKKFGFKNRVVFRNIHQT